MMEIVVLMNGTEIERVKVYNLGADSEVQAGDPGGRRVYRWEYFRNGRRWGNGRVRHRRDAGSVALVAAVAKSVDQRVPLAVRDPGIDGQAWTR